jgi:hypothetical protein
LKNIQHHLSAKAMAIVPPGMGNRRIQFYHPQRTLPNLLQANCLKDKSHDRNYASKIKAYAMVSPCFTAQKRLEAC